jgi:hypothetical protein
VKQTRRSGANREGPERTVKQRSRLRHARKRYQAGVSHPASPPAILSGQPDRIAGGYFVRIRPSPVLQSQPPSAEGARPHSPRRPQSTRVPAHSVADEVPEPSTTAGLGPGLSSSKSISKMNLARPLFSPAIAFGRRTGDRRGRRRLRPRHRPGTDAFHRCDGAPKARAKLLPVLQARRVQTTPSPNRSPDPARQPALAPGLSLVPHGCGDPLIRLVQEPRNNRVLEGGAQVARGRSRPVRSRGRGPGPAVVPGSGTGRQSHRRLQGRGCFQRGASLVCEAPLWSFDREAVERGGAGGRSPPAFIRPGGSGLRLPTSSMPEPASAQRPERSTRPSRARRPRLGPNRSTRSERGSRARAARVR